MVFQLVTRFPWFQDHSGLCLLPYIGSVARGMHIHKEAHQLVVAMLIYVFSRNSGKMLSGPMALPILSVMALSTSIGNVFGKFDVAKQSCRQQ